MMYYIIDDEKDIDNDGLLTRLTNVNLYGGTHRRRFDSEGRGLGISGRRDANDLLSLRKVSPSPEGLLASSPNSFLMDWKH